MQNEPAKDHGLTLEGRAKLTVTGVEDVDCFSEDAAVIATAMGALTVAGAGLKVARLDLKEGRVEMTPWNMGRRKSPGCWPGCCDRCCTRRRFRGGNFSPWPCAAC